METGNLFTVELLRKKLEDLSLKVMKSIIKIELKQITDHQIYLCYLNGYTEKYIIDKENNFRK